MARPRWTALALGLVSATGFQPLGLWPLTLLALAGLIALLARTPRRREAALLGWLFGWGHFALSLNWIATAFTYQAAMPAWLGWDAVVGLAAFLALYPALATFAARALAREPRALVLALAGCWIVAEWLRSWVFTGFAWNPLGIVLLGGFASPGLAALAPWLGTYGLSGFAVLLAGALHLLTRQPRPVLSLAGFAAVLALAMLRPPSPRPEPAGLPVTLVQPGIAQEVLNDPLRFEDNVAQAIALSPPQRAGQRRLVLWPESGVPWYLADGYPHWFYGDTYGADPALARQRLAAAIGPGSLLLAGTVDLEVAGTSAVGARNSVTALDADGTVRARYAKAHLVPGGEYLPLRPLLEPLGLARLVPGAIDYWPGPGPATLDLGPWGKAGVQVCYEIIFSGRVTDRAHRPDYLFNPTNDGWFGRWGPPQHLAQARLRAIEEGLPVLRATTNGISAVIAPTGVVRASLGAQVAGRIDTAVPAAVAPTLFARVGNAVPLGWGAVLLALSLVASRRRTR